MPPPARGFHYAEQGGPTMTPAQVMALARKYGLPARGIMQIAKGESGLRPKVQQHDPGDGMVGYGLLQMTPNAWGQGSAARAYMEKLGGVQAMADPDKNMAMARFLYKAAGNSFKPWYGTKFLTDRAGEGSLGPIRGGIGGGDADSAGGGTPRSGGTTVTTTTPGTDNRAARAQLVLNFLDSKSSDPVSFAAQMRGLQDTPATSSTRTVGGAATPASGGAQSPTGGAHPSGVHGPLPFEGKPVAAWIQPILKFARGQGWKGGVNSGYRSTAEQTRIYNSGVRPAARPGTSNHEFTAFPGGAVDVSDAAQLSAILKRSKYANLLVWAGGKDPVHFSHPHGGSY